MDTDWLGQIGGALRGVRTPLTLGGLAVIVLCIIYNKILGLGIFPQLTSGEASALLTTMVDYVFWLALVAVVLGILGYLIRPHAAK